MSSKNTIDIYKPRDNFLYMTLKNFSWGVLGLCTVKPVGAAGVLKQTWGVIRLINVMIVI